MVLKYPIPRQYCSITSKPINPADPPPMTITIADQLLMSIGSPILADAKTLRIILTRESPDDPFVPGNFQCLEIFKKTTE